LGLVSLTAVLLATTTGSRRPSAAGYRVPMLLTL
jgi:hypothetical protein